MIEVIDLKKIFARGRRRVAAVDGVSFTCRPGEVFGLLGANGAGKTTTLRILATMLKPTSGSARVAGFEVAREPDQVRAKIGFLSTATALYGRLTAEEMVLYSGRLHGLAEEKLRERAEELFQQLGIDTFRDRRCDRCSTGMKQKISIARALIHDPPVMIFDEPTIGLDVMAARQIAQSIRDCRDLGKTVLFSTHVMSEVEKLCDRVAIIHEGRIHAAGTLAELRNEYGEQEIEEIFVRVVSEQGSDGAEREEIG
ncbi:MAG TPA: ATP-binding cassette domain-containing protein [Opitutales bacterium]|nr:ATP-binding cassette domain-containing protein [Opitutales bacterium]